MEYTQIKKSWKDIAFKFAALAILGFIAFNLIQIRKDVKEHYEAFDENPLLFGAKKYGIIEGRATRENGQTFYFNQEKMWLENPNQNSTISNSFNLSNLWANQT